MISLTSEEFMKELAQLVANTMQEQLHQNFPNKNRWKKTINPNNAKFKT